MPNIQARNVDDALYERIVQAAQRNERSMEGEVRLALARQYPDPALAGADERLSVRERWQRETGGRLQALLRQLRADGFGGLSRGEPEAADYLWLAGGLNAGISGAAQASAGTLMDVADGRQEMSPELAERLAYYCSCSAHWLLSGAEAPFPVVTLGTYSGVSWQDFFDPDGDGSEGYLFELTRIDGGRHDGTLMILRIHETSRQITLGVVTEAFYLGAGMGGGGYGNLKDFLLFLKLRGARLALSAWQFNPPEPDFDFWSVMGRHHPAWFRDPKHRQASRWLQEVLSGKDPGGWFAGGWTSLLQEIAAPAAAAGGVSRDNDSD